MQMHKVGLRAVMTSDFKMIIVAKIVPENLITIIIECFLIINAINLS